MRFLPALYPIIPVIGMLVYHTLLVSALTKDRRYCSRPYIAILGIFELILLSILLPTAVQDLRIVWFWDTVLLAARFALCPLWVWFTFEMSGLKPARLNPRLAAAILAAPLVLVTAAAFSDPFLHRYWSSFSFEGRVLVARRSALSVAGMAYCQTLVWVGVVAFIVGIRRHYGRERVRLILFFVCFTLIFAGDTLWRLSVPLPAVANALCFALTVASFVMATSVAFIGFPRAREPVSEGSDPFGPLGDAWGAKAGDGDTELDSMVPRRSAEEVLAEIPELSARQREIASLVVSGTTYRVIAERFGCAERTVKYHMGEILDKCGLETREQLIAWVAVRRTRPR
jgi:DNA-binding CsgD family transcriptional regulator